MKLRIFFSCAALAALSCSGGKGSWEDDFAKNKEAYGNNDGLTGIHQLVANEITAADPTGFSTATLSATPGANQPVVNHRSVAYLSALKPTTDIQWDLVTDLIYFAATVNESGYVTNSAGWPASAPIAEAHSHGVNVLLSSILFGSTKINTLINSPTNRARFISTMFKMVRDAGADGMDIDFEVPSGSDRDKVSIFIKELRDYVDNPVNNPEGKHYIISMATPVIDWNNSYNYPELCKYVDFIFIMAYDYHWQSAPNAGPVTPFMATSPWATGVMSLEGSIQKLLTGTYGFGQANKNKIVIGLPWYGYRWQTVSTAKNAATIGSASALLYNNIMENLKTRTRLWDSASNTPYYLENISGKYYQTWFEDPESFDLKLAYIAGQNLGGVGMFTVNYGAKAKGFWDSIRARYAGGTPTPQPAPLGSKDNPIVAASLPFVHNGTTANGPSDVFNAYSCDVTKSETGPEVIYQIAVAAAGKLTATISYGSGIDVDVHILSSADASACLARGDLTATADVSPGTYYVVVDTYKSSIYNERPGAYTLNVSFTPTVVTGIQTANYSLNTPNPYPNLMDQTYTITQANANWLRIHFTNVGVESNYDFVYIYDAQGALVDTYTGNLGAFWSEKIPGNTAKIRIFSDSSVTGTGFSVDKYEYETGPASAISENITGIATPSPYANSTTYQWVIDRPGAKSIKVHFDKFLSEKNYDFLEVYDASMTLVQRISGELGPVWTKTVNSSKVTLKFVTDGSVALSGLNADRIYKEVTANGCPADMVKVDTFCVDRFESALVELINGAEVAFSPYQRPTGKTVKAVNGMGMVPQAYISQTEAAAACTNAGKRLCSSTEWVRSCRGSNAANTYPYGGTTKIAGNCNIERPQHPLLQFFYPNTNVFDLVHMNDPGINQQANTVAKSGQYGSCMSDEGTYDMVGNLHEWTSDVNGTFLGGFYADGETNGKGCNYATTAHDTAYHDYSTGFRCCK